MNNLIVQKTLIELEENLKNLESARKNVENVSAKGEQIITAFNKVLKQIEILQNEFNNEKNGFNSLISTGIKNFNSSLDSKSIDFVKKIKDFETNISASINGTIQKLNLFETNIKQVTHNIQNLDFEKNFGDLKTLISGISKEINEIKKISETNKQAILEQLALLNQNQTKSSRLTLILMIVGFIAVIAAIFIFR